MPRSQGFARGDFDTSFPIDDKFLALRVAVDPARYYAATGVYWHVVAAAWREAERKPAGRICPDAEAQIADLVAVKLLDPDERLPNRAFLAYVGRAKRHRSKTSDRQRQHREGKSRVSHGMSRVTNSDSSVTNALSQSRARSVPPVTGEEGLVGGPGEGEDPEWPVLSYLASIGAAVDPNGNGIHRKVIDLVRRRGVPAVMAALEESYRNDPKASGRQLVFGAENSLDRPLAKAAGHKGHHGNIEEVNRAFGD